MHMQPCSLQYYVFYLCSLGMGTAATHTRHCICCAISAKGEGEFELRGGGEERVISIIYCTCYILLLPSCGVYTVAES